VFFSTLFSKKTVSSFEIEKKKYASQRKRGDGRWKKASAVAIEILNGELILSRVSLSLANFWDQREHKLQFSLNENDVLSDDPVSIRVRIWTGGLVGFSVCSVNLSQDL
jgi:hypothetical protein